MTLDFILKPEEQCVWHKISRTDRKEEVARGQGLHGTEHYEEIGCYDTCDGYNVACNYYQPMEGKK